MFVPVHVLEVYWLASEVRVARLAEARTVTEA